MYPEGRLGYFALGALAMLGCGNTAGDVGTNCADDPRCASDASADARSSDATPFARDAAPDRSEERTDGRSPILDGGHPDGRTTPALDGASADAAADASPEAQADGGFIVIGDKAVLPGATSWDMEPGFILFVPVRAPEACSLFQIGVQARSAGSPLRVAVYSDVNDLPAEKLATAPDMQLHKGENTVTATPPYLLVAGATYWIAGTAIGATAPLFQNPTQPRTKVCYVQTDASAVPPSSIDEKNVGCTATAPSINWFLTAKLSAR